MTARGLTGAAQDDVVRGITSFALYGFPESHAASFALIAWASAWLKQHHPAAFLAGLLDAWPMGFYSPATLVKDAQRHGVEVRPIDVAHSSWQCTLEAPDEDAARGGTALASGAAGLPAAERAASRRRAEPIRTPARKQFHRNDGLEGHRSDPPANYKPSSPAVRLPLRFVRGLRAESARRLERARAARPFAHAADLAQRAALSRDELLALAELGALASIDPAARTRRAALWQVAGLERDARSLFAGAPPADRSSPLPEMSPLEATLADYRASGVSAGPHVMAHLREALAARGVLPAAALRDAPDGRRVRTAGHVVVRQRPGSAKGMCFLTLEDETGTANAVLTPPRYRRFRVPLHTASLVEIEGPVQNLDGVVHVRVERLVPLPIPATLAVLPESHDYR